MRLYSLIVSLLVCYWLTGSSFADYYEDLEHLKSGVPKPMQHYIERVIECEHWGGEEPYDKPRRREIERNIRSLHCQQLARDAHHLAKRYSAHSNVQQSLQIIKTHF